MTASSTAIASQSRAGRGWPRTGRWPMADDLFAAAVEERLERRAPLAARLRPRTLDEVVGQEQLLGPGRPLRVAHRGRPALVGDPLGPAGHRQDDDRPPRRRRDRARRSSRCRAVTAGVKDVREVVERARARLGEQGRGTILFLDEVHRFNRPSRTRCSRTSRRACSSSSARPPRTRSSRSPARCSVALDAVPARAARARRPARRSLRRALADEDRGLGDEHLEIDDDALDAPRRPRRGRRPPRAHRRSRSRPRSRPKRAPTRSRSPTPRPRSRCARCATATTSTTTCSPRSSRASAAPTSTPGSTGSPACSRPARTPRFIARRLVILASEDVGMADPAGRSSSPTPRRARSSSSGCPRRSSTSRTRSSTWRPRRSRTRSRPRSAPRWPTCATARRARSRRICGTPTTLARRSLGTARATSILTTTPEGWVRQEYRPDESRRAAYWRPTGRGADVDRRAAGTDPDQAGRRGGVSAE